MMDISGKIAVAVALLSLTILFQPAMAVNDPPSGGGWVSGDWTVTDARSYDHVDINLYYGNLVIQNGGSLTLDRVNLYVWMGAEAQFSIEVQSGGTLVVKDGSTISCAQSWLHYNFLIRAGATVTLGNSTIRETYNGINVASDNVTIDSCTITDSAYGVYIDGSNPRVSNSVFQNIGDYGIWVERSSPVLSGDNFPYGYIGIYSDAAGPVISRCSFTSNYYGIYVYHGDKTRIDNSTFTGQYYDGVLAAYYSIVDVRDSTFTDNGPADWWYGGGVRFNENSGGRCFKDKFQNADYGNGVVCDDSSSPAVDNCNINTYYRPGVYSTAHAGPRVANCTITSAGDACILASDSASPEVGKCVLSSSASAGAYATGYGSIRMNDTSIDAQNYYGIVLDTSASVAVRDGVINARYDGVTCTRSTLQLYHTTVDSSGGSGISDNYASTVLVDDNSSVDGAYYGVYVSSTGAYARVSHSSVNGKYGSGMVVTEGAADILDLSSVSSTYSYGLYSWDNGTVNSYNSTITSTSASYIYLDAGGNNRYSFVNTIYDPYKVVFTEPTSVLNNSYFLDIAVQWQNGAPVPNASVSVSNALNDFVFVGQAGESGDTGWLLMQESSRSLLEWQNFTPLEINAATVGLSKTVTLKSMKANTVQRITLVDPDPPKITIASPKDGSYTNSSMVEVTGTASDAASGLAKVEWMTDSTMSWAPVKGMEDWTFSTVLSDGNHLIRARAFDDAGISVEATVSITVDTTISLDVVQPADGAYLDNSTVTVSGVAEPYSNVSLGSNTTEVESDGFFEFALELPDGPHDISVTARDAAGNSLTVTRHILVDTVAPALVLDTPANGTATSTSSILFSGHTEPGARLLIGGMQYFPDLNGSFWAMVPLVEGDNVLEVEARDAAGNSNNTTLTILLDTVPPVLRVASPAADLLTNVPLLKIYGDTDGTEVLAGAVNATVTNGSFSADYPLAEGLNYIIVKALDEAGNSNTTVLVVTLDTVPPYLQLISPAAGLVTNNAALAVSGVTEPGASVTVNGLTAANENGSFAQSVRLGDGNTTVSVKAVDGAGNVAYVNRTVVLDTVPPALTVSQPSSGMRTSDSKTTVKGVTDPGSTVTVNGVHATVDLTGRFTAGVPLSVGDNSIVITSVDQAGNPTTKIVKVTRTGGFDIGASETPMMLLGLLIGIVIGVVGGLVIGRRRRKEQTIVMAPEEPVPGQYDVPEEPSGRERPAEQAGTAPPAAAPEYRPPPWERRPDYDRLPPRSAPADERLAPVPEAEAAPAEEVRPIRRAPEEEGVPWEEEGKPAPGKGPEHLDRSLDDIMKRLKT